LEFGFALGVVVRVRGRVRIQGRTFPVTGSTVGATLSIAVGGWWYTTSSL